MAQYLISTTETYRADTEEEAKTLIEDNKHSPLWELEKYSSTAREQKQKGEVVQSWYKVTLTKFFNDEKEPTEDIAVGYTNATSSNIIYTYVSADEGE